MKEYIKKSELGDYIDELSSSELVDVWNTYCRESENENEIYDNDEYFFDMYFNNRIIEAVRAVSYGEYNYTDEYVIFNGCANLETFNNPEDHIDRDELISYIEEHPEEFDIELEGEYDIDDLNDFVEEYYDKVKYVWKKNPANYTVGLSPDGEFAIYFNTSSKNWENIGNLKELYHNGRIVK
jgi:hypothetical protein